jgi:hypothetical protein
MQVLLLLLLLLLSLLQLRLRRRGKHALLLWVQTSAYWYLGMVSAAEATQYPCFSAGPLPVRVLASFWMMMLLLQGL